MIAAGSVAALVRSFPDDGDGLAAKSRELILALLERTPDPFSRDQFGPGHITCTGLVLHPSADAILLVHHRRLDRWLLPGGHVEPDDGRIQDAARREVVEETGAQLDALPDGLLTGLDVHGIPPKRDEPFHLHHDLIFGFRAISEVIECSPESRAVSWCGTDEFDRYDLPESIRRSYARMPR
jgi:8-oxo-dGTP pyrophosphatase MutT (NUDIX family)